MTCALVWRIAEQSPATRFDFMKHPELVLYDVADRIATLTFNRPDRMNAMTGNMELAFFQRLQQAEADRNVRVIIVTGAGKGWCPGADLAYRAGPDDLPLPNTVLANSTPLTIRKPVIAAINGACAGAGLGYAMMCDFRVAVTGAKFTTAFSRRGLIAEYGLAHHLSHIAGRAVALDLLLTARVVLAEEMQELGLVHQVVASDDLLATARDFATDLAANVSPASMATIKRQIMTEPLLDPIAAVEHSNGLMYESIDDGVDIKEGISSFLEKRQVEFPPLGEGTPYRWMDEHSSSDP